MQRTDTLLAALFLSIAFASHSGATIYSSDGSDANVQAIHDTKAHDGDTITLPAGTFIWTAGVNLTKGITVSGQTTITGAGTASCTANDQTIIIDEKPRNETPSHSKRAKGSTTPGAVVKATANDQTIIIDEKPRNKTPNHSKRAKGSTTPRALVKATIPAGKSFRLTGVTFRRGSMTTTGSDGAMKINSTGLVQSARIDHCHFDHLTWGTIIQINGWIYGVDDHNLIECNGRSDSHTIWHSTWDGARNGNGSWADFPYYGSGKFWFIEDNTIKGSGTVLTSGGIDASHGGRWVARHNYWSNSGPQGHGTEGGPVRGMRCDQVYNNTFYWTMTHGSKAHRSGSTIWHDNVFLGTNSTGGNHTNLPYYRLFGGVTIAASNKWGCADGENGWDSNDSHGEYFHSTAASNTTISGSASFAVTDSMTPNAFVGMQIRNDNPASTCYRKSSTITRQTDHVITYTYYGAGDRGAPLVFNTGEAFSIRKVLIALDQNGRGKGDLISVTGPRHWPNQQQETCFSWNNKNTDTGQVLGIGSQIPTQHEGSDYINLGAGLPANQIPAQVTAAYPASVNGGSAYDHEFTYPHPLVTGGPTLTPTPTSSPTATATATHTPTPTPKPRKVRKRNQGDRGLYGFDRYS
jgi:hypothetical protein